jgi:lipoyl-dependent peroxiredoxin
MIRKATAQWQGTGKEGKGTITTTSGVLNNTPYSWSARFENESGKEGTNPEELIAAAHASCFTLFLSFQVSNAGLIPDMLNTEAAVTIEKVDGKNKITTIHLNVTGKVKGITQEKFQELADNSKAGCPVSMALAAVNMTMEAKLV